MLAEVFIWTRLTIAQLSRKQFAARNSIFFLPENRWLSIGRFEASSLSFPWSDVFRTSVPNIFKVVVHLRHTFNTKYRKEYEAYFFFWGFKTLKNMLVEENLPTSNVAPHMFSRPSTRTSCSELDFSRAFRSCKPEHAFMKRLFGNRKVARGRHSLGASNR